MLGGTIFTQYSYGLHTVFIQYSYSIHTVFTQYPYSLHTVFTQSSYSLHTFLIQYSYSARMQVLGGRVQVNRLSTRAESPENTAFIQRTILVASWMKADTIVQSRWYTGDFATANLIASNYDYKLSKLRLPVAIQNNKYLLLQHGWLQVDRTACYFAKYARVC